MKMEFLPQNEMINIEKEFDSLLTVASAFAMHGDMSEQALHSIMDEALNNESKDVNVHKKPSRICKAKKISERQCLSLIASSLIAAYIFILCQPIYYGSAEDTFISSFLNHPYTHVIIPKEYGQRLNVFYVNQQTKMHRFMRMLSFHLGLQSVIEYLGKEGLSKDEDRCFLFNPAFYKKRPCSNCSEIKEIVSADNLPSEIPDGFIHLFENAGVDTSLDILRHHVSENLKAKRFWRHSFISNVNYVKNVDDLKEEQVISSLRQSMNSDAHIIWTTKHYAVSFLMKQIFPIPPMLMHEVIVGPERALLIDGALSPTFKLPLLAVYNAIYIQGMGSRRLRFIPHPDCLAQCSTHTIIMQELDVLIYDAVEWTVHSIPSGNDTSFALVGSLSFPEELSEEESVEEV